MASSNLCIHISWRNYYEEHFTFLNVGCFYRNEIMSSNIVIILLLYGNIILLTHILLTPLIEVYLATNVKKKFVTTKFWKIFKLSHPIVMAGGAETMFTQITLTFSKNNMERYYPYTWISFINQKNEKIRNWSLLMKIIYLFS